MRMHTMRQRVIGAATALFGLASPAQVALAFPDRPITLIVPFAAGGANDITARLLAGPLGTALGQRIVIENRGGAGGNIGITAAQRAKPDGYTLLLASTGFVVNPSLYEHVTYDPLRDFAPVAYLAQFPIALVVNKTSQISSMRGLIELAKAKPGALNYSSAGTGTATHLAAELVKIRAGIQIVHVPHSGAAPALQSLLGENVELGSMSVSSVQGHIQAGTLIPLAVTGASRWPDLPDVPTRRPGRAYWPLLERRRRSSPVSARSLSPSCSCPKSRRGCVTQVIARPGKGLRPLRGSSRKKCQSGRKSFSSLAPRASNSLLPTSRQGWSP